MSSHARNSLEPLFRPRSVAVVGASRNRASIGFSIVDNLLTQELSGAVFPVNPHAEVVHSLKCYPSLTAIPDHVDLAVIAVPKAAVPAAVEDAIAKGVRGLVVITAGFGETGPEGAAREHALRLRIREAGLRMVGPNCMGIINTEPDINLNATFAPVPARRGAIGFVSQSGALGVAILNVADQLGLGLTQFVSMGNKADVSGNDMLEYWEHDDETRIIAMYLESFGNPRRFTEIAKRVSRKKPILVVKSGRTAEGAKAASSHTGAMAGADVTVSAFLERCGVLRADTIEELFDLARAFDRCTLPAGDRVALLTNAGGPAIMATDACVNLELKIAHLEETTRLELASFLPPEASLANPVDMIASATPESYERALTVLLADPGVDMVLAINVTPLLAKPSDVMEAISRACQAQREPRKPVLAVMMATEDFYEEAKLRHDQPPVFRFPEAAARAMARMARYAEWRRRPADEAAPVFAMDDAAIATILARTSEGYLPIEDALAVLEAAGIPTVPWRFAQTPALATEAAREIGFPVVLKADAVGLVHKSDLGAVEVGLEDADDVGRAANDMGDRLRLHGLEPRGFLVQSLARGGHEVIFGISTDPRFGPLLMFGLGGKYVEVFRDVRFTVTPLTRGEAREVIAGIRGFRLLEGVRGEPGADLEALEDVLLRLAQVAQRHPTLSELDLNPFLASADRSSAVALDVRIRTGSAIAPAGE